ncbi:MAG: cell division protein FtsA, partial [Gemmatimonadales bacterium]
MKREALVAGLDLGSTKTCAVIAEGTGDLRVPGVRILGVGLARTSGVKRGVVRDIEETTRSIGRAMRDAERMAGVRSPTVYCGIAGEHVRTQTSTGLASVTADEIRRQDTERVDDVARAVSLGDGYELLHRIPQEYKVDSQGGISDPAGMTGLRLEVEMCLVGVQSQAAQNLR